MSNHDQQQRTATGAIQYGMSALARTLCGVVLAVYLPRALPVHEFATYSVLLSVMTWPEMAGTTILGSGLPKLIADRRNGWISLAQTVLLVAVIGMALVGLLAFLLAPGISRFFKDPSLISLIRLCVVDFPFYVAFFLIAKILTGRGLYERQVAIIIVYWLSKPLLTIPLVTMGLSVPGAILGSIGASMLGLAVGWRLAEIGIPAYATSLRPLWVFSWPLVLGNLFFLLACNVDMWFVKRMVADPNASAYYGIARNLYGVNIQLTLSAVTVAVPSLVHAITDGDARAVRELIRESYRFVCVIGLATIAVFVPSARELITIIFGGSYAQAAQPASLLLFGSLWLSMGNVGTTTLMAAHKPGMTLVTGIASLITGVGLNLVLVPRFGVMGAAAGTSAAFLVLFIIAVVSSHIYFQSSFSGAVLLRCVAAAAVTSAAGMFWPAEGGAVFIKSVMLTGLYGVMLFLLGELKKEDFLLLRKAVMWWRGPS